MSNFMVINHIDVMARALTETTLRGVCEQWGSRPPQAHAGGHQQERHRGYKEYEDDCEINESERVK